VSYITGAIFRGGLSQLEWGLALGRLFCSRPSETNDG